MKKILNAIRGGWLLRQHLRTLPSNFFTGKRVAIIGPANSLAGLGLGSFINGFDVVVRINKSALLVHGGSQAADIGSKTTCLFHSFFENNHSGGGPLDLTVYQAIGLQYLINPRSDAYGRRNTFNFYKKYGKPYPVWQLPLPLYKSMFAQCNGYRPTIGFATLATFLQSQASELFVAGFTFYRTPYAAGYRDHFQKPEQVLQHIQQHNDHDTEAEFRSFRQLAASAAGRMKLHFDPTLTAILEQEKAAQHA